MWSRLRRTEVGVNLMVEPPFSIGGRVGSLWRNGRDLGQALEQPLAFDSLSIPLFPDFASELRLPLRGPLQGVGPQGFASGRWGPGRGSGSLFEDRAARVVGQGTILLLVKEH